MADRSFFRKTAAAGRQRQAKTRRRGFANGLPSPLRSVRSERLRE